MKSFQKEVDRWILECFGEKIGKDPIERNYRFLEEALELVQACGCSKEDAMRLVDYVFDRTKGELYQEIGGVMVTLAALCNTHNMHIETCADLEIERITQPEIIEKIRKKQVTKDIQSKIISNEI
jgi:NTP pyrophosphatase (non-canonical NTP hydrolase)